MYKINNLKTQKGIRMEDIEKLKEEADGLGITYQKNIGAEKLQAKIDAHYDELDSDGANKAEVKVVEETAEAVVEDPRLAALKVIKEQERKNKEAIVVKVTMVDKRESSHATSAYFSTGDIALRVPLDEWVEMPRILVNQAEEARAVVHHEKDGVMTPKLQKKYVVEYKQ
jgi:hypothetical protein